MMMVEYRSVFGVVVILVGIMMRLVLLPWRDYVGVSDIRRTLFGGPYHKDPTI